MKNSSKYGFHKLTKVGDFLTFHVDSIDETKRLSRRAASYAEPRGWGVSTKTKEPGVISITRVR
tara:strand:- start:122 stop:313 length:192 start_codon:yes stop_codon:yes gene_type:complete